MRIGFDCAKMVKGVGKSIGIYNVAKSVIAGLARQLPKEYQLVVIGNEKNREDFDIPGVEFVVADLNVSSKKEILLWELFRVNGWIKKLKLDKIVFPRGFTSFFCPVPDCIIVHDLIPFFYDKYFPGVLNRLENLYIMMRLKGSIKSANQIITISEYSQKDITRIVPSAEGKIQVIYHGYDKRNHAKLMPPDIKNNYFFGVVSKLPHKNGIAVVKAYMEYFKIEKEPYDLALAGVKSLYELDIEIPEEIKEHIHCQSFADDQTFYSLFKYSKGLVFLSLIEGFGLPPLEAMELQVPVICSDRTSLPEVVREAGILVNPDNDKEVAQAMKRLTEEPQTAEDLIRRGTENLENFRWEEKIEAYIKFLCS